MTTGILVALIAACASFIGLVITKEAKISEFRHEWIGKLRNEIVDLTAAIDELRITGFLEQDPANRIICFTDQSKTIYTNIIRLIHSIKLRLNPDDSDGMLGFLDQLESVVLSQIVNNSVAGKLLNTLEEHSHKLLKQEWERVKKGEEWFHRTKYAILFLLASLVIMFSWDLYKTNLLINGCA